MGKNEKYNISIISPLERETLVRKASPVGKEDFYYFRGVKYSLPIIRIGINVPLYRMENFRTFTHQKEFIRNQGKSNDYFLLGQNSESAQQVQHSLLTKLARVGKDGSVTPIEEILRKEKQREPLLITSKGIIVNGNRRLAAMRELYSENSQEYNSFSHINVMVLPEDTTEEEIVDIEACLQAKPETKLEYDWIAEAQLIKRQLSIHKRDNVAERLNRTVKEIEDIVSTLLEADIYLKDWAQAEGDYSRIRDEAGQLFKDIPKKLEGKDTQLKEASRIIAWTLFDNKEKLPGRVYNFNAAFGELAADVLDRLSKKLEISINQSGYPPDKENYPIDISEDADMPSYNALIQVLRKKDDENVTNALIKTCEEAIEFEKGQKSEDAALKGVSQAHSKLQSVDITKAGISTLPKIRKQLDEISKIVNTINNIILIRLGN